MKIYTVIPETDIYHSYRMKVDNKQIITKSLIGNSLINNWQPIPVTVYKSEKRGEFTSTLSKIICTKKSKEILEQYIENSIEFLPLINDTEELFLMNVTKLIPINLEKSDFDYYPGSTKIAIIDEYSFNPNDLKGSFIFKPKQMPHGKILVSDKLKAIIEENNLEGLIFKEVFEV